jgi:hypothetical protein
MQIKQALDWTPKFGTESGGNLPDQKQTEEIAVMCRPPWLLWGPDQQQQVGIEGGRWGLRDARSREARRKCRGLGGETRCLEAQMASISKQQPWWRRACLATLSTHFSLFLGGSSLGQRRSVDWEKEGGLRWHSFVEKWEQGGDVSRGEGQHRSRGGRVRYELWCDLGLKKGADGEEG